MPDPKAVNVCPWFSPAQARVVLACITAQMDRLESPERAHAHIASRSIVVALAREDAHHPSHSQDVNERTY